MGADNVIENLPLRAESAIPPYAWRSNSRFDDQLARHEVCFPGGGGRRGRHRNRAYPIPCERRTRAVRLQQETLDSHFRYQRLGRPEQLLEGLAQRDIDV